MIGAIHLEETRGRDRESQSTHRHSVFRRSWRRDVQDISNHEITKRDQNRPSVGTRGRDQRNREISRKESAIGKSEIGELRIQKRSSSEILKY
jgi:hypothetical protein